jgi:opacity protein-like surface antigen
MKKLVLAVFLGLAFCTAGAFAEHPDKIAIGIVGQGGYGWGNGGALGGPALSLKMPSFPVYWGINLDLYTDYFGVGVTGDYYFIDDMLAPEIGLGWYLGIGGYVTFGVYNHQYDYNDYTYISFGGRVPIGLSWQFIRSGKVTLELFGALIPSLGLGMNILSDEYKKWHTDNKVDQRQALGLGGGIGGEIGLRIWF